MLFGDGLVSFDLEQDCNSFPVFMIGHSSPVGMSTGNPNYTLHVQVHINVSDRLKGMNITRHDLTIGHYGPVRYSESQEYGRGKIIMRLEYVTNDLDGFLDILRDKTWGKFEKEFTEQLEAKLSETD